MPKFIEFIDALNKKKFSVREDNIIFFEASDDLKNCRVYVKDIDTRAIMFLIQCSYNELINKIK